MKRPSRTALCLLLLYFFFQAGYMSYFPFLSTLLRQRGFSVVQISLLTTCTAALNFLGQFPAGRLSVRLPGRRMLLPLLLLSVPAGFALMQTGQSLPHTIAAAMLVNLLDFTLIGQLDGYTLALSARDPAVRYSDMRACAALTGAVFSFGMGRLLDRLGTPAMAWFHAGLMLLAALVLTMLPDAAPAGRARKNTGKGLFCPRYLLLLGCILLIYLAWRVQVVYLPVLLTDLDGGARLPGLSMAIASLSPLPVLAAWPRIRRRFSLLQLLPFAVGVLALRSFLVALAPPVWVLLLQQAGEGLSFGLLGPGIMELLPGVVPERDLTRAVSVNTGVQMALCTILCSGIVSGLVQRMPLHSAFAVFGILCLPGGAGLALLAARAEKEEQDG